jgi:hypothetical protein
LEKQRFSKILKMLAFLYIMVFEEKIMVFFTLILYTSFYLILYMKRLMLGLLMYAAASCTVTFNEFDPYESLRLPEINRSPFEKKEHLGEPADYHPDSSYSPPKDLEQKDDLGERVLRE